MTKIEWGSTITEKLISRFLSYVRKTDKCWIWEGGLFTNGYGQFRVGRKKVKAHRFSWIISGGFIPDGYILLHKCDNPQCVRPDHLFLGTHKDNSLDRDRKNRGAKGPNLAKGSPGELNGSAKLTQTEVFEIRQLRDNEGFSYNELSSLFDISPSQIANIIKERSWQIKQR